MAAVMICRGADTVMAESSFARSIIIDAPLRANDNYTAIIQPS